MKRSLDQGIEHYGCHENLYNVENDTCIRSTQRRKRSYEQRSNKRYTSLFLSYVNIPLGQHYIHNFDPVKYLNTLFEKVKSK